MDPRITKTKRDIRTALIDLLKEMPYEKVTIKLVSERAMVARPTFYAHYNTIQDILIDYLSDQFESAAKIPELPIDLSEEAFIRYFKWIRSIKEVIDLLYKNNLEAIIFKLNKKYIYDKAFLRPEKLSEYPSDGEVMSKYVELMGGILFAQVVSLCEHNWQLGDEKISNQAYKISVYAVDMLIKAAKGIE